MERETLTTLLLILLGGLALQPLAMLPLLRRDGHPPQLAERRAWLRLWLPVLPVLAIAAWLAGWALFQPDPVHGPIDGGVLVAAALPFLVVTLRALVRAAWALLKEPDDVPICTAGLIRPRVVISPFFARSLDAGQLRAAWQHEQAHLRHRDPLRIWLGQFAADLQWPWPSARRRLQAWLEALELSRDDEARRHGVAGEDLAGAIVATLRRLSSQPTGLPGLTPDAALLGSARFLEARIDRLLKPLPTDAEAPNPRLTSTAIGALTLAALLSCAALGALYGARLLHPLLAWTVSM